MNGRWPGSGRWRSRIYVKMIDRAKVIFLKKMHGGMMMREKFSPLGIGSDDE
jgi:hypothetical protein